MEENAIMGHNYSVSHSAITLMVFNREHIRKLNGMGTPPNRTTRLPRTCSLHPAESRALCLMGNTLSLLSCSLNARSRHPALNSTSKALLTLGSSSASFLVTFCPAHHSPYKLPSGLTTSGDPSGSQSVLPIRKQLQKSIVTPLLSPITAAQPKTLGSLVLGGLPPPCQSSHSESLTPARFVSEFLYDNAFLAIFA